MLCASWKNRYVCVLAAAMVGLSANVAAGQGFTSIWRSNKIELQRRLPPLIDMSGKTVDVRGSGGDAGASSELQGSIESLLTGADSTVHVQRNSPDVLVTFAITRYNPPEVKQVSDGKTVTHYVSGLMIASYNITEPQTSHLVASGVATYEVNEEIGSSGGSPFGLPHFPGGGSAHPKVTPMEAEKTLYSELGRQIAAFLVKTTESVTAQVAVGKELDPPRNFAYSKLWPKYLEALETMTPNPDPRLDAYRIYDIGLANEALAYQSSDAKAAMSYLEKASNDYGKVIDTRPDEKGFLEPQNRIKAALAHYAPPPPPPPMSKEDKEKADGILTDGQVIEMAKAKMDEASIIDIIQTAPKYDFDISVDAQVKMAKDGVSAKVLALIRQKARAAAPAGKK